MPTFIIVMFFLFLERNEPQRVLIWKVTRDLTRCKVSKPNNELFQKEMVFNSFWNVKFLMLNKKTREIN